MRTRYDQLQSAGDTLDKLIKQLVTAGEKELAMEAEQLQNKLTAAEEAAWKPEYAEPELEAHS